MKRALIAIFSFLALCSQAGASKVQDPSELPSSFESREDAQKYAKAQFAGGEVKILSVRNQEILVLFVYGSGVPDLAIAAYLRAEGQWRLKSMCPLSEAVEIHQLSVEENEVWVVGAKTKRKWRWPVFENDEKEANQSSQPSRSARG